MTYTIFDNGNMVASFDRADEAEHALVRLAAAAPDAQDGLLLVTFDADGNVVAEVVPDEHALHAA